MGSNGKIGVYDLPERIGMMRSWGFDVEWKYIDTNLRLLRNSETDEPPNLCPDFQRGHVWTDVQRQAYIEYILSGGIGARQLWWNEYSDGRIELVDGLQRLTTVQQFMCDELRVFPGYRSRDAGYLASEIQIRNTRTSLRWDVNCLPTRALALRWYLELNGAGTPHAPDELDRVRALLSAEEAS